jgi:hypothetical protein
VGKGNVTSFVAATCADTDLCNYRVYYKNMGGDPAPTCEKDFNVTYSCGKAAKVESCSLAAEAGRGGEDGYPNHFCLLHCLAGTKSHASTRTRGPASRRSREARTPAPVLELRSRVPW